MCTGTLAYGLAKELQRHIQSKDAIRFSIAAPLGLALRILHQLKSTSHYASAIYSTCKMFCAACFLDSSFSFRSQMLHC